nr:DNA polymerase [Russula virescens]
MGDYYNQSPFTKLIFNYGFKRGEIVQEFSKSEINLLNYKDMKLPISINPNDFGKILETKSLSEGNVYIISDKIGRIIIFTEFAKENLVKFYKTNNLVLEFKDIKISDTKFMRILNNKNFFFENGDKTLEINSLNTPFIKKLKKDKLETNNFITLDIETYGSETLVPYLISFYNGSKTYSFYLGDYNSIDSMMEACFKKLFVRKYNKFSVYIHNLAKFDIVFLLKYLIKHVQVNPIIHKGRIIQLNINYGPDLQYNLNFKDSYLMLLSSLEKLGKSFNIEIKKSIFPHLFVNENNLNYIGEVPNISNFFKISENEYQNYKKYYSFWNLKREAIKYCEIDCISLYQIILKFNSLIFGLFNKNIHKYPTLPSLAFAIFRGSFMENENIPKLTGNIEKDIRQSYTGGSTDMFIPHGQNIHCYDVNSLYPSVMIDRDMPIDKVVKFEGDISKFEKDAFGFCYVKVNRPEDIMHPILQIRYKSGSEIRTISPVGNWSMWIFSEEMYNALKYGYTFEILEGYTFERGITFKIYVEFLYNLRLEYSKDNPLNLIAKILLNSLYGRFGMNEILLKYEILSKEEFEKIEEDLIKDFIELEDNVLVGLKAEESEDNSNVSIAIAAAITAYARIHMSKFKNNSKIRLFYTDTDSIYTDSEIDGGFIDNKVLGKLKLENTCRKAIFLAPKVYYLETEDGKVIYKVKGLSHDIELSLQDFEQLLYKDSFIEKTQTKWTKNLSEGHIKILEQIYTLQVTDNKREYLLFSFR